MIKPRIGHGYDVHAFAPGLPLILGGIQIEHSHGCVAHSDGDVLLHAICDALLGAAALGDIGLHFPDTSDTYKGIDSSLLLARVATLLREKGFEIGNIDSTLILQRPKIKPYVELMRQKIADTLSLDVDDVSVKATTSEHLGFTGREEGVAAHASVIIYK